MTFIRVVVFNIWAVTLLLLNGGCKAQHVSTPSLPEHNGGVRRAQNPYPTIPIADFVQVWQGQTNCTSGGQSSFPLNITLKDSTSVYVSGFNGSTEKLSGVIRGYTIAITRQNLPSIGKDIAVEARLVLNNDRQTLRSFSTIYNGTTRDTCKAEMHK
jgi:hypothetical protein